MIKCLNKPTKITNIFKYCYKIKHNSLTNKNDLERSFEYHFAFLKIKIERRIEHLHTWPINNKEINRNNFKIIKNKDLNQRLNEYSDKFYF